MACESATRLLEKLQTLQSSSGAYTNFQADARELAHILKGYFNDILLPCEKRDILIGNNGLLGETNNSLAAPFNMSHHAQQKADPAARREASLLAVFMMAALDQHESQFSRKIEKPETVLQAFERIRNDIDDWVYKHRPLFVSEDLDRINTLREQMDKSLDEIWSYVTEAKTYFTSGSAEPVNIPESYRDRLQLTA